MSHSQKHTRARHSQFALTTKFIDTDVELYVEYTNVTNNNKKYILVSSLPEGALAVPYTILGLSDIQLN